MFIIANLSWHIFVDTSFLNPGFSRHGIEVGNGIFMVIIGAFFAQLLVFTNYYPAERRLLRRETSSNTCTVAPWYWAQGVFMLGILSITSLVLAPMWLGLQRFPNDGW